MNETTETKEEKPPVPRLEKNGQVAVLYSPGYGAGWASWNPEYKETLLFDKEIVEAVLRNDIEKAKELANEKAPGAYLGGGHQLEVRWLTKGTVFEIEEYDGNEEVYVIGERSYNVA